MQEKLKKISKFTLSIIITISVLTLNIAGFLQCSELTMNDNCCHITKKIKPCCLKHTKVTLAERISSHCGCTMQDNQPVADLYNDIKTSNSSFSFKIVQYSSLFGIGYHSELMRNFTTEYSPPIKDQKDSYLTNLSLRI